MSDDDAPKRGYKHPPKEHQFPPYTSGNSRGRPLGSKNKKKRASGLTAAEQILQDEMSRQIASSSGPMAAFTAVIRAQLKTAGKGSPFAQRDLIDRAMQVEQKIQDEQLAILVKFESYKRQCDEMRLYHPEEFAKLEPLLIPHPDDVEADWSKRTVKIHGPANAKEAKVWKELLDTLAKMRALVFEYRRRVAADPMDVDLNLTLLRCTHRFMRHNERLPERYQLRRLPVWRKGKTLPMPELPDRPKRNLRRAAR
ncbi:DUF5681 domain-containing protein [Tsuneonella sp. HG094]